jgi:hypothetical protein
MPYDHNDPFAADPARVLIMEAHDAARRRHEDYTPTAEELRQIMIKACAEVGSPEVWCHRLGCTPAFLNSVLTGRRPPSGPMLDTLGLEWLRKQGVYADPLFDRRAQTRQRQRWSDEFRSAEKLTTNRILRDINREAVAKAAKGPLPAARQPRPSGDVIPFPRRAADDDDLDETFGPK